MASKEVILYDITSKVGNHCWSPNVWKTRLVLNYKGIPYTTKFLEHKDIYPTLEGLGLRPTVEAGPAGGRGVERIMVPAVQLPDGSAVMDSAVIAPALEKLQAAPSLRLETGLHEGAGRVVMQAAFPLLAVVMPAIARNLMTEASLEIWLEKRRIMFGMPLDEVERTRGGEVAWQAAQPGLDAIKEFLRAHKKDEGPFVLGSVPSYADFIFVGLMAAAQKCDPAVGHRLLEVDPSFRQLYNACGKWLERDD